MSRLLLGDFGQLGNSRKCCASHLGKKTAFLAGKRLEYADDPDYFLTVERGSKLCDDWMKNHQEHVKLRTQRKSGEGPPRENPAEQGSVYRAHDKTRYARWTTKEFVEQAQRLDIRGADKGDCEQLIEAPIERETSHG